MIAGTCLTSVSIDAALTPQGRTDPPAAARSVCATRAPRSALPRRPRRPARTRPLVRDLTRYRKALIYERSRAVNRLHKLLEDAGVKLSCVATDVMGVSGRAMMRALIDGNAD
ncbi:MAG: IS110 family transposase, partial [Actinobacteria bacterium]|nr:IS110 family transposase [Actinomycetota bacterium]